MERTPKMDKTELTHINGVAVEGPPYAAIPTQLIIATEDVGRGDVHDADLSGLIKSIQTIGLLHPITVRSEGDNYIVLAGNRRLAAVRALEWPTVPCRVLVDPTSTAKIGVTVMENLDRKQLSPWEEAQYCLAGVQALGTIDTLAAAVHRSIAWVRSRLEVVEWPDDCQAALQTGDLSFSALSFLSQIADPEARRYYLCQAVASGITARVAADWVRAWKQSVEAGTPTPPTASLATDAQEQARTPPSGPCFACGDSYNVAQLNHMPICPRCLDQLVQVRHSLQDRDAQIDDPTTGNQTADPSPTP